MARGQRPPAPEALDAVTLDAHGILLELRDPVAALGRLLAGHDRAAIERAFQAELAHYREHVLEAGDEASLERLHTACTAVFNDALGSSLTPEQYVGALEFAWVAGARVAVERLRGRGLALAVVSNWDISLRRRLQALDVPVVVAADAGARKPDPRVLELALERLGVDPGRALHVGDDEVDEECARRGGVAFAPGPLADLVEGWT